MYKPSPPGAPEIWEALLPPTGEAGTLSPFRWNPLGHPGEGGGLNFSDPDFLDRVRKKDPEALTAVVHAYGKQIFRAALGAGLREDEAEEAVQETLTAFVQNIARFEGRSHIRTWLFGILYNKIAESRRKRKKSEAHDSIDDVIESRFDSNGHWIRPPRDVEEIFNDGELRAMIGECLEGLSEKQKNAFVLKEVEGFPTMEICEILDVTGTNLGVLLYRARNGLRECLESKGVERG